MKQYHQIQLEILQKLMYSNGLRFAQMLPQDMEGSQFSFHLDQLIKAGLVEKDQNGYQLTNTGKELANRMDLGDSFVQTQAKISVIMVCVQKDLDTTKYLLYTRHKSPFFGYQGFPTGKVKKGEDVINAAIRELKEETNLDGEPILSCIRHYKIYSKEKDLLEDRLFFVYRFNNPKGELKSSGEGDYKWVKKEDVWEYLKKPVNEVEEIIQNIDNLQITFKELSYVAEGF